MSSSPGTSPCSGSLADRTVHASGNPVAVHMAACICTRKTRRPSGWKYTNGAPSGILGPRTGTQRAILIADVLVAVRVGGHVRTVDGDRLAHLRVHGV
jgi:hypothetical protein